MKYHNITGRQQENKSLAEKTLTPQKLACVCIIFIQGQVLKQFGSFHKYLNVLVVCGLLPKFTNYSDWFSCLCIFAHCCNETKIILSRILVNIWNNLLNLQLWDSIQTAKTHNSLLLTSEVCCVKSVAPLYKLHVHVLIVMHLGNLFIFIAGAQRCYVCISQCCQLSKQIVA